MVGVARRGESGHHRAKRLDAVQEIRPRVVDGHARVVRILSPTLGGRRSQVVPDLLVLVQVNLAQRWGARISAVDRLELGPLIRRSLIAKRIACHRHRRFQLLPALGLPSQVGRQRLGAWC